MKTCCRIYLNTFKRRTVSTNIKPTVTNTSEDQKVLIQNMNTQDLPLIIVSPCSDDTADT